MASESGSEVSLVDSGRLVTTSLLDRETTPSVSFAIGCHVTNDSGKGQQNLTRPFKLILADENDNPPVLQGPEDQIFHVYLKNRPVVNVRQLHPLDNIR